jgi:IMP dehydrogenase
MLKLETQYSLDDILLEPQHSDVMSRLDTDISTKFSQNLDMKIPIVATNMSTITEYNMMKTMDNLGGLGILHRFMDTKTTLKQLADHLWVKEEGTGFRKLFPVISLGVGKSEFAKYQDVSLRSDFKAILIDVAHADHTQVFEQLEKVKRWNCLSFNPDVLVGNIATYSAAQAFLKAGVNGLRVGIGGGSRCITRTVTGHGVPNLSALLNVVKARDEHYSDHGVYIPVIMDGGIKTSGDIVKALYFGADSVCIGGLLAGCPETPGEVIETENGSFKKYYGMASKDAQDIHKGGMKPGTAAEGFSELVPVKPSVKDVVGELVGGVRSGLSYSGARNIKELREFGRPYFISEASRIESKIGR